MCFMVFMMKGITELDSDKGRTDGSCQIKAFPTLFSLTTKIHLKQISQALNCIATH